MSIMLCGHINLMSRSKMENSIVADFFVVFPKILFFFVFVRVMLLECLVRHDGVPHCSPRVGLSLLPLVSGTLSAAEFSIASESEKKKKWCFLFFVASFGTHPPTTRWTVTQAATLHKERQKSFFLLLKSLFEVILE